MATMIDRMCGEDGLGGFGLWSFVIDQQDYSQPACSCDGNPEDFWRRKQEFVNSLKAGDTP
jgi:hypothetical protein